MCDETWRSTEYDANENFTSVDLRNANERYNLIFRFVDN